MILESWKKFFENPKKVGRKNFIEEVIYAGENVYARQKDMTNRIDDDWYGYIYCKRKG